MESLASTSAGLLLGDAKVWTCPKHSVGAHDGIPVRLHAQGVSVRRAAKTDTAQSGIVEAIEAEGWECFLIRLPCDLLCWHPVLDVLQWMEVKSARKKSGEHVKDKRQEEQIKFLERTNCPVVTTAEEALSVLRKFYPT